MTFETFDQSDEETLPGQSVSSESLFWSPDGSNPIFVNLDTSWCQFHGLQIWTPGGATCNVTLPQIDFISWYFSELSQMSEKILLLQRSNDTMTQ